MHRERSASISIAAFLVLLLAALAILARDFFAPTNVSILGTTIAISAVFGIGALVVMATGNIDVSAGAIFGMSGIVAAQVSTLGVPPLLAVLAGMATGAGLGAINGLLVAVVDIPSIIATLGTASVFTGGLIILTGGGTWVVGLPDGFTWFGSGSVLGVPVPVLVATVLLVAAWWYLTKRPSGRTVFAVGSNLEAARLSGIRVKAVEGLSFVVNGTLLGLAATLTVARLGQAQNNVGATVTMAAITIAVVGGTSAFGGTGTVLGIVLATGLVELTSSALIFFHVDTLWTRTIQGVFIVAALVLSVSGSGSRRRLSRMRFLTRKGAVARG